MSQKRKPIDKAVAASSETLSETPKKVKFGRLRYDDFDSLLNVEGVTGADEARVKLLPMMLSMPSADRDLDEPYLDLCMNIKSIMRHAVNVALRKLSLIHEGDIAAAKPLQIGHSRGSRNTSTRPGCGVR